MEKLDEVDEKVYKALQEVRCVQDTFLEHQVSIQEQRGRCGCRGQRSSSAHPLVPDRPTTAADEPHQNLETWHGPLQ